MSRPSCPSSGCRGSCCAFCGSADGLISCIPKTVFNPLGVKCFVAFRTSHSLPCNQKYCGSPRLLDMPIVRAMFGPSGRQFLYAQCSALGSLICEGFGGPAKPSTCPSVVATVCNLGGPNSRVVPSPKGLLLVAVPPFALLVLVLPPPSSSASPACAASFDVLTAIESWQGGGGCGSRDWQKCGQMRKKCGKCGNKCEGKCGFVRMVFAP